MFSVNSSPRMVVVVTVVPCRLFHLSFILFDSYYKSTVRVDMKHHNHDRLNRENFVLHLSVAINYMVLPMKVVILKTN